MEDGDRTSLALAKGRSNKQWLDFQRLIPPEEHIKWYLSSQISQVHLAAWSRAAQGQSLPKAEPAADQKRGWTSPCGVGLVAAGRVSVGEGGH